MIISSRLPDGLREILHVLYAREAGERVKNSFWSLHVAQ